MINPYSACLETPSAPFTTGNGFSQYAAMDKGNYCAYCSRHCHSREVQNTPEALHVTL